MGDLQRTGQPAASDLLALAGHNETVTVTHQVTVERKATQTGYAPKSNVQWEDPLGITYPSATATMLWLAAIALLGAAVVKLVTVLVEAGPLAFVALALLASGLVLGVKAWRASK